jgi:hypothetical protein
MTTKTATILETADGPKPSVLKLVLESPASGALWFIGWLFTIGYAHLIWWKALLAVVVWPYFLGVLLR